MRQAALIGIPVQAFPTWWCHDDDRVPSPEFAVILESGEIAGKLLSVGDDSNGLFNAFAKFSLPPVVVVTFNRESIKAS